MEIDRKKIEELVKLAKINLASDKEEYQKYYEIGEEYLAVIMLGEMIRDQYYLGMFEDMLKKG